MPSFDHAWRWVRLEPELGDNRKLPEAKRFFLEVAAGLTKDQMQALFEGLAEKTKTRNVEGKEMEDIFREYAADLAAAFGPFVRMGSEPLRINGAEVKTLADYFGVGVRQKAQPIITELFAAVRTANSVEGTRELFSGRHSGGFTFTGEPSAELDESPRGAR